MIPPLIEGEGHEFAELAEPAARELLARLLPDLVSARETAATLVCPLCGRGPYRSLAIHIPKKHDLPVRWLMDHLDLPLTQPLLASALWQRLSDVGLAKGPEHMDRMRHAAAGKTGAVQSHRMGRYGREAKAAADQAFIQDPQRAELLAVQTRLVGLHAEEARLLGVRAALIETMRSRGVGSGAIARGLNVSVQTVIHATEHRGRWPTAPN